MSPPLWLVPALPLAGALVLALAGRRLPRWGVDLLGVVPTGLAALVGAALGAATSGPVTLPLWRWMRVGGFAPEVALRLDALALVMVLVVTGVGFLILLYSVAFMAEEPEASRFFAAMSLFVAAMLVLVLADDLLLLYLGWEGVGLCSYLLIGFWRADPGNDRAARKAFLVTRLADAALVVGLVLIAHELGTLRLSELGARAVASWEVGSAAAVAAAALLLAGAVGKSAQLPLQVWLPDAMAGPTPVSALIHAATMVTAGVYLVARTHPVFERAPAAMTAAGAIGAVTLLAAGASALVQSDVKRVLAWSTVSQLGYMFVALGVGAWSAAVFHLTTHAAFKALLFLAAGVLIRAGGGEHDLQRLRGLRRSRPLACWSFGIGAASLAGLPLVTAGFYSKDWILQAASASGRAGATLAAAGLLGTALTGAYAGRAFFLLATGDERKASGEPPRLALRLPLVVLAALAVALGFLETPPALGGVRLFSEGLAPVLSAAAAAHGAGVPAASALLALAGLAAAWALAVRRPAAGRRLARAADPVVRLWRAGWGFDALYDRLAVRPWRAVPPGDAVDVVPRLVGDGSQRLHAALSRTQTLGLRRYAAAVAAGAVLLLALAVLA